MIFHALSLSALKCLEKFEEHYQHSSDNLTRIELDVEAQDEMYWKVDQVVLTKRLSALHATFCPIEKEAMLRAVVDIVDFFRERAPAVAKRYGSTYPTELERLMGARLDSLVEDLRSDR